MSLATLTIVTASLAPKRAGADGIERLRSRAQMVADQVNELEHTRASLGAERNRLQDAIGTTARDIGPLELQRHESDLAYRRGLDDYVDPAVEVYKGPSQGMTIELLLSARDVNQLVAFSHLASASAEAARESLGTLNNTRSATQILQSRIDERKQKLLTQAAAVDALASDIDVTLEQRRDAYDELNARIKELEAEARAGRGSRPQGGRLHTHG